MKLSLLVKSINLNESQMKSLYSFLSYTGWSEREVSSTKKIKHKELMSKVQIFGRTLFEDKEIFIASMNVLIDELIDRNFLLVKKISTTAKLKCQVDKLYESSEIKVKLLKYLQGKGKGKRREEIAEHFNVSENSLTTRIQELRSPDNHILGTKVQIDLQRGTNLYESTVHPFFLALNLSEVYGLLTNLMKAEKSVPGTTMTDIIKDIVSQLTDYAKDVLRQSGMDIDVYATTGSRFFRNESPENKYYHALKTGSLCRLWLRESEDSLVGRLKINPKLGKEFIFHTKGDEIALQLGCEDIKDKNHHLHSVGK